MKVIDNLNFFGLSIWIMDDASYMYQGNFMSLPIRRMTINEAKYILKWFNGKLLYPKLSDYNGFRLIFNVNETKNLIKKIRKYIPRYMDYKIGLDKKRSLLAIENQKDYRKRYWKKNGNDSSSPGKTELTGM